jgi:NAD(P)-dependent dehydrogenase (short-subunit alcohol dehydrogenase family)
MRFSERVAIVTGAAQGIGRATAQMLVEEGATVVMNDIDGELVHKASAEMSGAGRAIPMVADVTQADQVERMVKQVVADLGRIDVLVNNAGGIVSHGESIETASVEYWKLIIDWNLTSQFLCSRSVIPTMKTQHYGRIVNVSTDAGIRGTLTDDIAYPAAKAGVLGLTRELARYLGRYGINVNAICPGDTLTETTYKTIEDGLWPETLEELLQRHARLTPVGRPAKPREIAACILFLASEAASYITGETLMANGGFYLSNIPAGGIGARRRATQVN